MKTYYAIFAEFVPYSDTLEISAANDAEALHQAKQIKPKDLCLTPDYEYSFGFRIAEITDDDRNTIVEDILLSDGFVCWGGEAERRLCNAARDMLNILEELLGPEGPVIGDGFDNPIVEEARRIIAKAKGGQP